jgi:hypothetical protein
MAVCERLTTGPSILESNSWEDLKESSIYIRRRKARRLPRCGENEWRISKKKLRKLLLL